MCLYYVQAGDVQDRGLNPWPTKQERPSRSEEKQEEGITKRPTGIASRWFRRGRSRSGHYLNFVMLFGVKTHWFAKWQINNPWPGVTLLSFASSSNCLVLVSEPWRADTMPSTTVYALPLELTLILCWLKKTIELSWWPDLWRSRWRRRGRGRRERSTTGTEFNEA